MDARESKPGYHRCELTDKRRLGPDVHLLTLALEQPIKGVYPFSFVMVTVPGRPEFLLKRPLSIFYGPGDDKKDRVEVLVRTAGEGTKTLSSAPAGTRFDLTGPFGNAYEVPGERVCVVAGGIGAAGIYLFAKENVSRVSAVYFGSTTAWEPAFYEILESVGAPLEIATDDGTLGRRGMVTDLLMDLDCETVVACGPPAMLERVYELSSEAGILAYGSFEARMACGVGACRGCALPVKPEKTGGKEYLMVCKDGPLFDMKIINWERYRAAGI
jgi:dihydroorotate dehydrogenase electron transfer subunit